MAMASSKSKHQTKTSRIQSAPAVLLRTRLEGHVVADLGFEGSRHMLSNQLPSARGDRVVGLRLPEFNSEMASSVFPLRMTLKRLDLSGIRLTSLPEEMLVEMSRLERLDISKNQIRNLNPLCEHDVGGMESLVELLAYDNRLKRMPTNFCRLQSIRRLNLAQNYLSCCEGIDELKCLQVLILDNNRLESFSAAFFENVRRLEVLHCAYNKVTKLPSAICNFRHLRNADFSGNKLGSIPADLLQLNRLEVLNLSRNCITRVPTTQLRGTKRRPMSVDLSDNLLVKFPGQLLTMSRKLDLSGNQIRRIPMTITRYCLEEDDKILEIDNNPLISPPLDVCQCGIRAILRYFHESEISSQTYQGPKVFVIGSSGQGKTSLVQTLIDEEPRLTGDSRTDFLDIFDHYINTEVGNNDGDEDRFEEGESFPKTLHLSVWDFSGNGRYLVPLYRFIHLPSLVLLVFSLADYSDSKFELLIGNWLHWIISKTNKLVLLLVATHSDAVSISQKEDICTRVSLAIKQFLEVRVKFIDREIKIIESKAHIVSSMSEHLKQCLYLKRLEAVIHPQVIAVSSKKMEGFSELLAAVKFIINDSKVYPHLLQQIPSLWDQVESYVGEKARSLVVPYLTWKEYEKQVVERYGMKRTLPHITQYLHNSGKLLWFSESGGLREFVFLRPEWLMEVLRNIFRNDLPEAQFSADEYGLKAVGLGLNKFERLKRDFHNKGILDRDYLRCILWPLLPSLELNKSCFQLVTLLMHQFQLGYVALKTVADDIGSFADVIKSIKSANDTPDTSQPTKSADKYGNLAGNYVVSCLRKVPRPRAFKEHYETICGKSSIAALFRFALYMPPGIFESLAYLVQSPQHNFTIACHWETGLYAIHKVKSAHLFIQRKKLQSRQSAVEDIRLEVRLDEDDPAFKKSSIVEDLWSVSLPLFISIDSLLLQFTGIYVERRVECPLCHKASFTGEWQTPKQLQSVATTTCDSCHQNVDTAYLVQPREKRVVDQFLQKIAEQRSNSKRLEEPKDTPESAFAV